MATIRTKSSHISGSIPPILVFGFGLLGSDRSVRKTEGNLAVGEQDATKGLDCEETRSGIQHADALRSASFLVGQRVRIWSESSPWSELSTATLQDNPIVSP